MGRRKCTPKTIEWLAVDLANQLGPFCPLAKLRAILRRYPAPGNPDYAYFQGFLEGREPKYAARCKNITGKLVLLNFLSRYGNDRCFNAQMEGRRDGLLIQLGEFD